MLLREDMIIEWIPEPSRLRSTDTIKYNTIEVDNVLVLYNSHSTYYELKQIDETTTDNVDY